MALMVGVSGTNYVKASQQIIFLNFLNFFIMSLGIETLTNVLQKDGTRTVTGYSNEEVEVGSSVQAFLPSGKFYGEAYKVTDVTSKTPSGFKLYKYHYELVCES